MNCFIFNAYCIIFLFLPTELEPPVYAILNLEDRIKCSLCVEKFFINYFNTPVQLKTVFSNQNQSDREMLLFNTCKKKAQFRLLCPIIHLEINSQPITLQSKEVAGHNCQRIYFIALSVFYFGEVLLAKFWKKDGSVPANSCR